MQAKMLQTITQITAVPTCTPRLAWVGRGKQRGSTVTATLATASTSSIPWLTSTTTAIAATPPTRAHFYRHRSPPTEWNHWDECHRAHLARSVRPVRDVRRGHRALAVVFFDHKSGVAGKGACYLDAPDMAPLPAGPSRGAGELDDGAGCGQPTPKSSAVAINVL